MKIEDLKFSNILYSYSKLPRDVHTYPLIKTTPKWFYVYVERDILYVETAKEHEPKSAYKSDDKFECPEFRKKVNND